MRYISSKGTFSWFLVYSVMQLSLRCNFRTFSPHLRDTPYSRLLAHSSHAHSHPSHSHQPQATTDIFSVFINFPIWTFHVSTIIQYVLFCDWLLSLNIMFLRLFHVVECINTSFFKLSNRILFYCMDML